MVRVKFLEGEHDEQAPFQDQQNNAEAPGLNEWDIYKRYSDFASLNDMLLPFVTAKGVKVPQLPPAIPNI